MPRLQKLVEKYGPRGFTIVTINTQPDEQDRGISLMARRKYDFINLQAPRENWAREQYSVVGSPTNYLLDNRGRIMFRPSLYDDASHHTAGLEIEELLQRGPHIGW